VPGEVTVLALELHRNGRGWKAGEAFACQRLAHPPASRRGAYEGGGWEGRNEAARSSAVGGTGPSRITR
jgi:hypothetical protein